MLAGWAGTWYMTAFFFFFPPLDYVTQTLLSFLFRRKQSSCWISWSLVLALTPGRMRSPLLLPSTLWLNIDHDVGPSVQKSTQKRMLPLMLERCSDSSTLLKITSTIQEFVWTHHLSFYLSSCWSLLCDNCCKKQTCACGCLTEEQNNLSCN